MTDPRPEKVAVVAEVKKKFEDSDAAVLTEYRGLDVGSMAELRRSMHEGNGELKVYKNTLVRFAVADLGLEIDEELLTGPTAIAFVSDHEDGTKGDPVSVAKALTAFAKTHPELVIKGGILDGAAITPEEVEQLSKIASREELLAKFAGGLAAPMQKFAALLKAVPQNFAYALSALIAAGGGPDAAPDAPPQEAEPATEEASADDSVEDSTETPVDDAPVDDAPNDDGAAVPAPEDDAPAAEDSAQAPASEEASAPVEDAEVEAAPEAAAEAENTESQDTESEDTESEDTEVDNTENTETPEEG